MILNLLSADVWPDLAQTEYQAVREAAFHYAGEIETLAHLLDPLRREKSRA
jgi:hypothetical protein